MARYRVTILEYSEPMMGTTPMSRHVRLINALSPKEASSMAIDAIQMGMVRELNDNCDIAIRSVN